jgi:hypothetical protein
MPLLYLSASTRRVLPRRILQLASLGLAGLLAGLLAGCSSDDSSLQLLQSHNDTDWQTTSSYASATAAVGPTSSIHAPHARPCEAGPCVIQVSAPRHPSHHRDQ